MEDGEYIKKAFELMTEFIIFIQSRRAHETIPRSVKILYKRGVS